MDLNSLYREARSGSTAAETELFDHLTVSFRLFVQRRIWNEEDTKEIVQDTLRTIAEKYRDVEIERSFAAWANNVLKNKLMDHIKLKRIRARRLEQWSETETPESHWVPEPGFKRKLLDCLRQLHRTSQRHARILNLHYQGFTTKEICDRLTMSSNNLYVSLSRARTQMQKCLDTGGIV